ncbi:MAG TPA: hypothetical protein VGM75_01240 [Pseudonocardiaceae bacterium]
MSREAWSATRRGDPGSDVTRRYDTRIELYDLLTTQTTGAPVRIG